MARAPEARTSARGELSVELLVDAAQRIIRRGGMEALSMRAVAEELGVSSMAAYHHVAGKDALIGVVVESVSREFAPLEHGEDGWEAALRRHLVSMWTSYRRYPGLGSYVTTHTDLREGRASAKAVSFLEEAGFDHDQAVLGWATAHTRGGNRGLPTGRRRPALLRDG